MIQTRDLLRGIIGEDGLRRKRGPSYTDEFSVAPGVRLPQEIVIVCVVSSEVRLARLDIEGRVIAVVVCLIDRPSTILGVQLSIHFNIVRLGIVHRGIAHGGLVACPRRARCALRGCIVWCVDVARHRKWTSRR